MRLARSYTSLLSLLVLLTIGTVTRVAARQDPNQLSFEAVQPIAAEAKVEQPTAIVVEKQIKEDPKVVADTDEVLQSMVQGATLKEIVDNIQAHNLSDPITTVFENLMKHTLGAKENAEMLAGTNVTVLTIIADTKENLANLVQKNGLDACMLLMEAVDKHGEDVAKKVELQQPINELFEGCLVGFNGGNDALTAAGKSLLAITKPYQDNHNLTSTDHAALKDNILTIAEQYRVAKQETNEEPRLQKRAFVDLDDVEVKKMTVRRPVDEIVSMAKFTAKAAAIYLGFKFAVGVLMRSTLENAGQQAAWNYFSRHYTLRDDKKQGLGAFQYSYEDVLLAEEQGRDLFTEAGVYTVSRVPSVSAIGGGPDMSKLPVDARPLFANMCNNVLALQRWQLGTSIHPESVGQNGWCRSTVLVYVNENEEGIVESKPLENLSIGRRNIGTISTVIETLFGLKPGYTMWTLGLILYTAIKVGTVGVTSATMIPMLGLAYSSTALMSLPALAADRLKAMAVATMKSRAWNSVPMSLRQMFTVGDFFRGRVGSMPSLAKVVMPSSSVQAAEKAKDADAIKKLMAKEEETPVAEAYNDDAAYDAYPEADVNDWELPAYKDDDSPPAYFGDNTDWASYGKAVTKPSVPSYSSYFDDADLSGDDDDFSYDDGAYTRNAYAYPDEKRFSSYPYMSNQGYTGVY